MAPLKPVMTRYSKSPLRYGTSKVCYDMAPLKPVTTQHSKNPLQYGTSKALFQNVVFHLNKRKKKS